MCGGSCSFLARSEFQPRWRSTLALILLVGVVGGMVVTASAGAERSATALDRFVAFSRSSDTELDVSDPTPAPSSAHLGQCSRGRRSSRSGNMADPQRPAEPPANAGRSVDGKLGKALDRSRVIAGRAAKFTRTRRGHDRRGPGDAPPSRHW